MAPSFTDSFNQYPLNTCCLHSTGLVTGNGTMVETKSLLSLKSQLQRHRLPRPFSEHSVEVTSLHPTPPHSPLVVTMLYLIQTMLITTANYLVHIFPAYHPLSPPQPLQNIHSIKAGDKSSRVSWIVLVKLGAHSFHQTLMARFQRRKPFEQLICFALLLRLMCEIYEEKLKKLRSWNWQKRNEIQSGPLVTQRLGSGSVRPMCKSQPLQPCPYRQVGWVMSALTSRSRAVRWQNTQIASIRALFSTPRSHMHLSSWVLPKWPFEVQEGRGYFHSVLQKRLPRCREVW